MKQIILFILCIIVNCILLSEFHLNFVYVVYELSYFYQIVISIFFNIIMPCPINIVRRIFVLGRFIELLSMIKRHYFVSPSMNYEYRAVYVGHAVDVREFVEGESETEVENHPEG